MFSNIFLFTVIFASICRADEAHRRFEYKYSFKGPHLVQKDGTVPFWESSGHAIPADESVRLTPSLRSKKGAMWCKNQAGFDGWEVVVEVRVSGRGRIGADGMAIWYTADRNEEGPVFGSKDQWNGLGVFLDSFDNDGMHNNPYILAMVNDGTQQFDHHTDGVHQQLGGCLKDFRNRPYPVKLKITYYRNVLELYVNDGLSTDRQYYEMCMRREQVNLPKNGYFGVSAATGGLADDQDVMSFITHSLSDPVKTDDKITQQEREQWQQEYDKYQEELSKAQEEYRKDHPEEGIDDPDKWFESQQQREFKQMLDGQSRIQNDIVELSNRISEVLGKQETALSRIGQLQQNQGGAGSQGSGVDSGISRNDVNQMMATQREILQQHQQLHLLMKELAAQKPAPAAGGSFQQLGGNNQLHEMNDHVRVIRSEMEQMKLSSAGSRGSADVTAVNCVTPFYFFLVMSIQFAVVIGYFAYRASKDAAAKKFY